MARSSGSGARSVQDLGRVGCPEDRPLVDPSSGQPLPVAVLIGARVCATVYGLAAVDARAADNVIMRALGWRAGSRLILIRVGEGRLRVTIAGDALIFVSKARSRTATCDSANTRAVWDRMWPGRDGCPLRRRQGAPAHVDLLRTRPRWSRPKVATRWPGRNTLWSGRSGRCKPSLRWLTKPLARPRPAHLRVVLTGRAYRPAAGQS